MLFLRGTGITYGWKKNIWRLLDIFWPGDEHNEWHVGLHTANSSFVRPSSSRRALMALCFTNQKTEEQRRTLSPSSSQGKENGYVTQRGVTQRSAKELMKPVSGVGLWRRAGDERGRTHQHPCNHWTHSPHSCSSALMSSCYINITKCSTMGGQRFGLQSLACDRFWEQATNPRIISAEPRANGELIFTACRLWAQHVLTMYTLMTPVFTGRAGAHGR